MKPHPYLIQRAKFAQNVGIGIDSILKFDYMGASEFEWGALPKSLVSIRKDIVQYEYIDIVIQDGVEVTAFFPSKYKDYIHTYINLLHEGKYSTKEYSDFDTWVGQPNHNTDFWWDIKNHIMFWKKNDKFFMDFKINVTLTK